MPAIEKHKSKRKISRRGLCNCGEELRKRGIYRGNRCDGTKYFTETTCRKHRKEVEEIIRRQLKDAGELLARDPVNLPTIIYDRQHVEDDNTENIDSNINECNSYDQSFSAVYHDDEGCDDGPGNHDFDYFPSNQVSNQGPPASSQSDQNLTSSELSDKDVTEGESAETVEHLNDECLNEGHELEDMTPEQKELMNSINEGTRAFMKNVDETNEEFCNYEERRTGYEQVHRSLADWRSKCAVNMFPGSATSIGSRLSEFLHRKIAQGPPIGHIWQDIDADSELFEPGMYPTSKEVKHLIRQLGLGFNMNVTCEHHHPSQPGKNRGGTCGYQDAESSTTCTRKLKIGIRYSAIEEYLRAKLLDPEFGMHIAKSNARWGSDGKSSIQKEYVESIFDGNFYKDTEDKFPDFFYSKRHEKLHFAIFVDGFQPFEGVKYTLWAVILICLNLPYEIRMKADNLHILTLIDGPKEPGNLQQYLKPIVDEFLVLWETGITVFDAYRNRSLKFKGILACCIQDGRASKACSYQAEAGHYQGCRLCTLNGRQANGIHYYGHRIMLPEDHPYRTDPKYGPPTGFRCLKKSHQFIMSRMKILENYPETAKDLQGMLGVQGVSEFSRLPYFDVGRCHILCFMHCMANLGMLYVCNELDVLAHKVMILLAVKRLETIYFDKLDSSSLEYMRQFLASIKQNSTITANFARFFMSTDKRSKSEDEPSLAKKRAQHYKDFAVTGVFSASLLAAGISKDEILVLNRLFTLIDELLSPKLYDEVRYVVFQEASYREYDLIFVRN